MPIILLKKFIKLESAAGIILFSAALIAIAMDNSFLSPYYEHILELPISIQVGSMGLSKHLLHWVNDGLMVIFFLMVGLEIKREIFEGELNSTSKVILPAAAALGGMLFPALVFTFFNYSNEYSLRGWAIPTATDIAFSLGILSLLGSRVPLSLKIFLTALAIFDDLGAIIVIAIFYTYELSYISLGLAALFVFVLFTLNRLGVKSHIPYFFIGAILWLCVLESGVHATLSGVILAMALPLRDKSEPKNAPAYKGLIENLHPWIAYFVLPVFALANAGVSFDDVPPGISNIFSPVMLGISLGLIVGKLAGVFGVTYLAVKLKWAKMPTNSNWTQIFGIAAICGVGFTMSFFVGTLAYPQETAMPYAAWVRLGVLFGSMVSGTLGYLVLRASSKNQQS